MFWFAIFQKNSYFTNSKEKLVLVWSLKGCHKQEGRKFKFPCPFTLLTEAFFFDCTMFVSSVVPRTLQMRAALPCLVHQTVTLGGRQVHFGSASRHRAEGIYAQIQAKAWIRQKHQKKKRENADTTAREKIQEVEVTRSATVSKALTEWEDDRVSAISLVEQLEKDLKAAKSVWMLREKFHYSTTKMGGHPVANGAYATPLSTLCLQLVQVFIPIFRSKMGGQALGRGKAQGYHY